MRSLFDTWLAFRLAGGSACRWSSTSGRLASFSLASKSPCESFRSLRFRKRFIQESSMGWQSRRVRFSKLDRSRLSVFLAGVCLGGTETEWLFLRAVENSEYRSPEASMLVLSRGDLGMGAWWLAQSDLAKWWLMLAKRGSEQVYKDISAIKERGRDAIGIVRRRVTETSPKETDKDLEHTWSALSNSLALDRVSIETQSVIF
ncbi:hypothetical protein IWX49DRAFT_32181 [Phyllosticta citricarpa]|uniref:Uncharacterized protein n=1 Tax=Phyllosticta citricarpa TaxID=55181 RepID=A0ABR1MKB7_9PEZI